MNNHRKLFLSAMGIILAGLSSLVIVYFKNANSSHGKTIDGSQFGIGYSHSLSNRVLKFYSKTVNGVKEPEIIVTGIRQLSPNKYEQMTEIYILSPKGKTQARWSNELWSEKDGNPYIVTYQTSSSKKVSLPANDSSKNPTIFVLKQPVSLAWTKKTIGNSETRTVVGFGNIATPYGPFQRCLELREHIQYADGTSSDVLSYFTPDPEFVHNDAGWVGETGKFTDTKGHSWHYSEKLTDVVWKASSAEWNQAFSPDATYVDISNYFALK